MTYGSKQWLALAVVCVALSLGACTPNLNDQTVISDAARAALPKGVSTSDILRDPDGCYSYFDRRDKRVRTLVDNEGNQICN